MRFLLSAMVALLLYTPAFSQRSIERRLALKPGQAGATITGRIPAPGDSIIYSFNAHTGQKITLRLEPSRGLIAQALLILPSGKQEGPGTKLRWTAEQSGRFQIKVIPREQTSGSFRLRVTVR